MRAGFVEMSRRGLRGLWVDGPVPRGPFVWAANHHSWWDPFLASVVLQRRASLIMLQDNLDRFAFLRRLGVFGTAEPAHGLSYLADGRVLVIFPEGELRPAGPLGPTAPGAAWFARRAGVPLYAVASRVLMRGHQAPEAYLTFTEAPAVTDLRSGATDLAKTLAAALDRLDQRIADTDPRQPPPGFRLALRGRRSWDERLDTLGRWRPWR
jgi:1-acyl-sn-glycerol-3-phosphate acyltransferase